VIRGGGWAATVRIDEHHAPCLKRLLSSLSFLLCQSKAEAAQLVIAATCWASSVIGVGLLLDFSRQFNKSPDCFGTGWEVDLGAPPVVYHPQKLLRHPHLKRTILGGALARSATATRIICHFRTFVLTINMRRATYHAGRWQAANSPSALIQATEVHHGSG
jgi:hypothetical protein